MWQKQTLFVGPYKALQSSLDLGTRDNSACAFRLAFPRGQLLHNRTERRHWLLVCAPHRPGAKPSGAREGVALGLVLLDKTEYDQNMHGSMHSGSCPFQSWMTRTKQKPAPSLANLRPRRRHVCTLARLSVTEVVSPPRKCQHFRGTPGEIMQENEEPAEFQLRSVAYFKLASVFRGKAKARRVVSKLGAKPNAWFTSAVMLNHPKKRCPTST